MAIIAIIVWTSAAAPQSYLQPSPQFVPAQFAPSSNGQLSPNLPVTSGADGIHENLIPPYGYYPFNPVYNGPVSVENGGSQLQPLGTPTSPQEFHPEGAIVPGPIPDKSFNPALGPGLNPGSEIQTGPIGSGQTFGTPELSSEIVPGPVVSVPVVTGPVVPASVVPAPIIPDSVVPALVIPDSVVVAPVIRDSVVPVGYGPAPVGTVVPGKPYIPAAIRPVSHGPNHDPTYGIGPGYNGFNPVHPIATPVGNLLNAIGLFTRDILRGVTTHLHR